MISELITFNGGLSTKTAPHLIGRSEGIVCQNVNLERGTLYPLSSFQFQETVNGRHIYNYNGSIISNQTEADNRFYDEYNGRLYWSNAGYATGIKRYDDLAPNAGILAEAPDALTDTQLSEITMEVDTVADGRLTYLAEYTYAFTVVDANGVESAPRIKASNVILNNKSDLAIHMKMLKPDWDSSFNGVHGINIYRVGGDNPSFNLIAEGLLATSTKIIDGDLDPDYIGGYYYFVDTFADINVSRIELTTFENIAPPDNLDMLIEIKGTFFGSWGKRVYFSHTGAPEFWGELDYVSLDKDCTGLGKFGDSIIAFTKTSAYIINGNNRDNISMQRLPFNQGCISKHSIANIDSYLVWASMNGICIFDGSAIQVITKKTLSWDEFGRLGNTTYGDYSSERWSSGTGFDMKYAVGYQDKYYGVFNNGIMVIDIANNLKVSTIYLENVTSVAYNYEDNFLYAIVDNLDGTFDIYAQLDGSSLMTATWKTGRITDGSVNVRKHYRLIDIDGQPESIKIYVDGVFKYESKKKSRFFLPSGLVGRDIQFEIESINEIRGLKYEYTQLEV